MNHRHSNTAVCLYFLSLFTLVCGLAPGRDLVGKWSLVENQNTPVETGNGKGPSLDAQAEVEPENRPSPKVLEMVFRADGTGVRTTSTLGFTQKETIQWKIITDENDQYNVHLSSDRFRSYETLHFIMLEPSFLKAKLPGIDDEVFFRKMNAN